MSEPSIIGAILTLILMWVLIMMIVAFIAYYFVVPLLPRQKFNVAGKIYYDQTFLGSLV